MDLINATIELQQAKVNSTIQIRVARKILDSEDQQGNAAIELIDAADAGVSKAAQAVMMATGLGGQVDVKG